MKTLKTTLGLFTLSAFLLSFTPEQPTQKNNTDTVTEQIQLQQVYETKLTDKTQRGDD